MDLTKPTNIIRLINQYNLKLRKSWGQNFLTSANAIEQIIAAAEMQPEDDILEIGPGLGTLTAALTDRARSVVALEIDPRLCSLLTDRFGHKSNLQIIAGDALEAQFQGFFPGPYKIVANLPYYITSPLIIKMLEAAQPPQLAVILVQLEVARRLAAAPGTKDYGSLTVAVQFRCQTEIIAKVGAGNFFPPPKVDSAVVRLRWYSAPPSAPENPKRMFKLVRAAFGQRRKMLRGIIANHYQLSIPEVTELFSSLNLPHDVRGERLSVEQFARLSDALGADSR